MKKLERIIIAILIGINGFLLWNTIKLQKIQHTNPFNDFEISYKDLLMKQELELNTRLFESIPNNFVVRTNGDSVCMRDIFDRKRFIYVFSISDCGTCIDTDLMRIRGKFSNEDPEKIVVFCYYPDVRKVKIYERIINPVKLFQIEQNSLSISMDQRNEPYFLIIQTDLKIVFASYSDNFDISSDFELDNLFP